MPMRDVQHSPPVLDHSVLRRKKRFAKGRGPKKEGQEREQQRLKNHITTTVSKTRGGGTLDEGPPFAD